MRATLLLFLLLASSATVRVLATIAQDEQFMTDLCTASANTFEWCTGSVVASVYCKPDGPAFCNGGQSLIRLVLTGGTYLIPASIGDAVDLEELRIEQATITDFEDEKIARAPKLRVLSIVDSTLQQSLPSSSDPPPSGEYPALEELHLTRVASASNGAFPQTLADQRRLRILQFDTVSFAGPIPPIYALLPLVVFSLTSVDTVGPLPVFTSAPTLQVYVVDDCPSIAAFADPLLLHSPSLNTFVLRNLPSTTGSVPPSLGSTTRLAVFVMQQLPQMDGPLPTSVRFALNIERFIYGPLKQATSTEPFPETLCELARLEQFEARGGVFTGPIPTCVGNGDWPRLASLTLEGIGQSECDPAANLVGTLPSALLRPLVLGQTYQLYPRVTPALRITDTCLSGPLPALAPGDPFTASPRLLVGSVRIERNRFVSPYPDWLRQLVTSERFRNIDDCVINDNKFCLKLAPQPPLDELNCAFAADGQFNVCGKCDLPDDACKDCKGVVNGPARVDRCGVCGGANACVDCAGTVDGSAQYDRCDVCDGDGQSCVDCTGALGGSARYDLCDVCNGDGSTCLDCAGVPFGSARYDLCDICGGSGSACADCERVIGGPKSVDACGDCVDQSAADYAPRCLDCKGVPNGTSVRDRCHVCDGDGSGCLDDRHTLAAQLALDRYGWLVAIPVVLVVLLAAFLIYIAVTFQTAPVPRRRPASQAGASLSLVDVAATGSSVPLILDLPGSGIVVGARLKRTRSKKKQ